MENREIYEAVELEVVNFEAEDIITASDPFNPDDNETPIVTTTQAP